MTPTRIPKGSGAHFGTAHSHLAQSLSVQGTMCVRQTPWQRVQQSDVRWRWHVQVNLLHKFSGAPTPCLTCSCMQTGFFGVARNVAENMLHHLTGNACRSKTRLCQGSLLARKKCTGRCSFLPGLSPKVADRYIVQLRNETCTA